MSTFRQLLPSQLFTQNKLDELAKLKDTKARAQKVESAIFDTFTGPDGSGELDTRTELQDQLMLANRVQEKLRSMQKF